VPTKSGLKDRLCQLIDKVWVSGICSGRTAVSLWTIACEWHERDSASESARRLRKSPLNSPPLLSTRLPARQTSFPGRVSRVCPPGARCLAGRWACGGDMYVRGYNHAARWGTPPFSPAPATRRPPPPPPTDGDAKPTARPNRARRVSEIKQCAFLSSMLVGAPALLLRRMRFGGKGLTGRQCYLPLRFAG